MAKVIVCNTEIETLEGSGGIKASRVRGPYNPLIDGDAPPITPLWMVSEFGMMTPIERRLEVLHHE